MVNISFVLSCLELSALVYNSTLPTSFKLINEYNSSFCQPKFITANQNDDLYIIIKGESVFADMQTMLNFNPMSFLGSYSNEGIIKSARYIINKAIDLMRNCSGKIIFTGHSFGGTVAAMAASIVHLENQNESFINQTEAVTFGAYPILSPEVSKKMESFVTGFVINRDIFPFMNPKNMNNVLDSILQRGTPHAKKGAATVTMILSQIAEHFVKEGKEVLSQKEKTELRGKVLEMTLDLVKTAPKAASMNLVNAGLVYHIFTEEGTKPDISVLKDTVEILNVMEVFGGIGDHLIHNYIKVINESYNAEFPQYK